MCMYFSRCSSFIELAGSLGLHSEEHWLDLLISYSFTDISNIIYAFDIVWLVILINLDQRKTRLELNVNRSWKSTGNLLHWICRHHA